MGNPEKVSRKAVASSRSYFLMNASIFPLWSSRFPVDALTMSSRNRLADPPYVTSPLNQPENKSLCFPQKTGSLYLRHASRTMGKRVP